MTVRTHVRTDGESFRINGRPTSEGHVSQGCEIEALLLNARMVQGIFDDRHPTTQQYWSYPDTERWDSERNTREFIAAMAAWWQQALVAFTLNLQGDNPRGYSDAQPWYNSAFGADGSLRLDYFGRLARILDRADELRMAAILGLFRSRCRELPGWLPVSAGGLGHQHGAKARFFP